MNQNIILTLIIITNFPLIIIISLNITQKKAERHIFLESATDFETKEEKKVEDSSSIVTSLTDERCFFLHRRICWSVAKSGKATTTTHVKHLNEKIILFNFSFVDSPLPTINISSL